MYLYDDSNYENSVYDGQNGENLWKLLCQGDRNALNNLFRLHYTSLFDYGMNITPNEEVVKDAIQELFLKLWKKHESLSLPNSVKAYLLASIRRILLRMIKKSRNRYKRNKKYTDNSLSKNLSREELIIRKELKENRQEALAKAIQHLNGRQKETLFLRYYHGLSNQEISDVININQQSVKNNLYRALKSLRGIIELVPDSQ